MGRGKGRPHGSATVRPTRASRYLKKKGRVVDVKRAPDLTAEEKWNVIAWCMEYYTGKKFAQGTFEAAEKHFERRLTARSIGNLCRDYLQRRAVDLFINMPSKRLMCGRPNQLTEEMKENIIDLHIMTGGELAVWRFAKQYEAEFGVRIPEETMRRYLLKMGATNTRSYLAPTLSVQQRIDRLKFIQKRLVWVNQHKGWRFKEEPNTVYLHSDEKWFYTEQLKTLARVLPDCGKPRKRKAQHKKHIPKLMFFSLIGGRYKVCIIPFLEAGAKAKRKSHKRPAGADVIKTVNVTCETYYDMWTREGGGLDQIRALNLPEGTKVVVQHDGAKPHTGKGTEDKLNEAGKAYNVTFVRQPAQSPDFNLNDLAFFYSLQCDTNELKGAECDLFKLKECVHEAFENYPMDKLERIHALLYEIYRLVIQHDGGNDFPMPHSHIRERQGKGEDAADPYVSVELNQYLEETLLRLEAQKLHGDVPHVEEFDD
jgi:hypothetical protein